MTGSRCGARPAARDWLTNKVGVSVLDVYAHTRLKDRPDSMHHEFEFRPLPSKDALRELHGWNLHKSIFARPLQTVSNTTLYGWH